MVTIAAQGLHAASLQPYNDQHPRYGMYVHDRVNNDWKKNYTYLPSVNNKLEVKEIQLNLLTEKNKQ